MNKQYFSLLVCIVMFCAGANAQSPSSGKHYGHEYVDLGLPSGTKWATCNVGADAPEECGDHFAWGDTETKGVYMDINCATFGKSFSELQSSGVVDSKGNLMPDYDAARQNWGGKWRMPSLNDLLELNENTTKELTTYNGMKGYKLTSNINGNSIFLPAAGFWEENYIDVEGHYWLANLHADDSNCAFEFYFNDDYFDWYTPGRYFGGTVRPVVLDVDDALQAYVPKGYELLNAVDVKDLNGDGMDDKVLVVKNTLESAIKKDTGEDLNRRGMIVLFATKDNGYSKAAENLDCFCSDEGIEGMTPPPLEVETFDVHKNLVFRFNNMPEGICEFTFRYKDGGFKLINYDNMECDGAFLLKDTKIDFLMGEKQQLVNALTPDEMYEQYSMDPDGYKDSLNESYTTLGDKPLLDFTKIKDYTSLVDPEIMENLFIQGK